MEHPWEAANGRAKPFGKTASLFKEEERPVEIWWRVSALFIETVQTKPLHLNYRQMRRSKENLFMIRGEAERWKQNTRRCKYLQSRQPRGGGSLIHTVKTNSLVPLGEKKSRNASNKSKTYFKLSFFHPKKKW